MLQAELLQYKIVRVDMVDLLEDEGEVRLLNRTECDGEFREKENLAVVSLTEYVEMDGEYDNFHIELELEGIFHVHMLVEIPPSISVSSFVGYLKGKSTLMIFERHANLKYKFGNRHFWCRGYYVDTVGKNAKKIQEYIQNQLKEDYEYDQITLKEYIDPFTGEPVKKNK